MVATIYAVLCMAIPCMLYEGMLYKKEKGKVPHLGLHLAGVGIFFVYLFCAILIAGIGMYGSIIRLEEINIIPLRSQGYMTYLLNVIMFVPLGCIVPLLWKEYRNAKDILKIGFMCSLSIEFCQLFNRRTSDIDDLIMNTLGTLIGFGIWYILRKVLEKWNEKAVTLSKKEPLICFLLAITGEFLLFNWRSLFV